MSSKLNVKDLVAEAEANEELEIPQEDIEEAYEYVFDDDGTVINTIQTK